MDLKYEGSKFLDFRNELNKVNIPEAKIHLVEDGVYYNLPGNYVFIYSLEVSPERKGIGTNVMKKIITLAEKYKINLFLFPSGTSQSFYSKFGFIEAAKKYENCFEPLKIFRFYNNYENELNNFLEKQKNIKNSNFFKKLFSKLKNMFEIY